MTEPETQRAAAPPAGPPDDRRPGSHPWYRPLTSRVDGWASEHAVAAVSVSVLAGFVAMCLRRPSAFSRPGLYAEDGVIFLEGALRQGAGAVFTPYNGYLHLVPRLVSAGGTLLPLSWTPWVYAVASAVVAVACSAIVLSRRFEPAFGGFSVRLVVFGLLMLVPRLSEVHLTVNSLLWWCGVALLLTSLADDPRTVAGRATETAAVPILVLSGLAGLVLVPLALLRWLRLRSTQSLVLMGLWWGAAAVQATVYAFGDRHNGSVPVGPGLVRVGIEKVMGSLVLTERLVDGRWASGVPIAVLVGTVLVTLVWASIVVLGSRWQDATAVLWTVTATVAAGFVALGPAAPALPDRYTVLAIAAVVVGLLMARPRLRALRWCQAGLLVVFVSLRVVDYVVPARSDTHWDRSVHCLDRPSRTCVIRLNPDTWTVTVPAGVR